MKRIISLALISVLVISVSSCTQTIESLSSTTTEQTTSKTTEATSAETTTETTEQTTIETKFVTSLPNMRMVEYDGNTLPDGYYLIDIKDVVSDGASITTRYVKGLPYLLDEDIALLNEGDNIIYKENIMTVSQITTVIYPGVSFVDGYFGLSRSYNGQWYLGGDADYWYSYDIVDEVHLKVAEDVIISDGYCPYWIDEETHLSYISSRKGNEKNPNVHFYNSFNELIQVREMSSEYLQIPLKQHADSDRTACCSASSGTE